MFTILIRYNMSKREVLISAKTVEFIRPTIGHAGILNAKDDAPCPVDMPGLLVNHGVEGENGFHLSMTEVDDPDWRDVFVMNAQGATVARYIL